MIYFLSLGSNLGNKTRNLARAGRLLREGGVEVLAASSIYLTEPVDNTDQPWFVNQVLEVRSAIDPPALLRLAKSVEKKVKRIPRADKGPRTIDIDILFAGDTVLDTPELVIPHPRLAQRNFVLVPLCEIAPEIRHPVLGKTIRELALSSSDPARVIAQKRRHT
jgi:2-amino-4-hydroxy-6-hydroxymethyldihydropteridine diphosphokinase